MLSLIFTILILGLSQAHSQNKCPNLVDNIYFAGYSSDLNELENCSNLNSSLFITGDYNILNLDHLEKLNTINGYLVVLDSHLIKNLKGLHNLRSIRGNEKYLKTSSVTFKYNNNFLDDENRGLCFTDLVNWTKITDFDVVDTNNGIDCPTECHSECIGCFGPGPRLCQECRHSKVGNTCVNYDCLLHTCDLSTPQTPLEISFERPEQQKLNISWNDLNISMAGGNIQEYLLYRDGELISHQYFNDSGYQTRDSLDTFYIDTLFTLDIIYFYRIEYVTETGSLSSNEFSYYMYDWLPARINNLSVLEYIPVSHNLLHTKIGFTSITNGVPYEFKFSLWKEGVLVMEDTQVAVEKFKDTNQVLLNNLDYFTPYQLEVYGFNTEYSVKGETSILDFITQSATTTTTTTSSTNSYTTSTKTATYTGTSTTPTFTSNTHTTNKETTPVSTVTNTSKIQIYTSTSIQSTVSSDITSSSTPIDREIKIINLVSDNKDSNTSVINIHNSTQTDKNKNLTWFIILIIIISILILFICLCLLCSQFDSENEVAPVPHTNGYANSCYKTEVIDTEVIDTDNVVKNLKHKNSFSCSQNPLYNSDSSIGSEDNTPTKYDEVDKTYLHKETYNSLVKSNDRLAINETYCFPEEINTNKIDNTYSHLQVSRKTNIGEMTRPSSAYRDIKHIQPPESQQFEIQPVLKRHRPTVRRNITDESIGRNKGNLMSELQQSIKNRDNANFEI